MVVDSTACIAVNWVIHLEPVRQSVAASPDSTVGSACTSTFSRFAWRLLALRPAHSRGHQIRDRHPGASDISSPPCYPDGYAGKNRGDTAFGEYRQVSRRQLRGHRD